MKIHKVVLLSLATLLLAAAVQAWRLPQNEYNGADLDEGRLNQQDGRQERLQKDDDYLENVPLVREGRQNAPQELPLEEYSDRDDFREDSSLRNIIQNDRQDFDDYEDFNDDLQRENVPLREPAVQKPIKNNNIERVDTVESVSPRKPEIVEQVRPQEEITPIQRNQNRIKQNRQESRIKPARQTPIIEPLIIEDTAPEDQFNLQNDGQDFNDFEDVNDGIQSENIPIREPAVKKPIRNSNIGRRPEVNRPVQRVSPRKPEIVEQARPQEVITPVQRNQNRNGQNRQESRIKPTRQTPSIEPLIIEDTAAEDQFNLQNDGQDFNDFEDVIDGIQSENIPIREPAVKKPIRNSDIGRRPEVYRPVKRVSPRKPEIVEQARPQEVITPIQRNQNRIEQNRQESKIQPTRQARIIEPVIIEDTAAVEQIKENVNQLKLSVRKTINENRARQISAEPSQDRAPIQPRKQTLRRKNIEQPRETIQSVPQYRQPQPQKIFKPAPAERNIEKDFKPAVQPQRNVRLAPEIEDNYDSDVQFREPQRNERLATEIEDNYDDDYTKPAPQKIIKPAPVQRNIEDDFRPAVKPQRNERLAPEIEDNYDDDYTKPAPQKIIKPAPVQRNIEDDFRPAVKPQRNARLAPEIEDNVLFRQPAPQKINKPAPVQRNFEGDFRPAVEPERRIPLAPEDQEKVAQELPIRQNRNQRGQLGGREYDQNKEIGQNEGRVPRGNQRGLRRGGNEQLF